MNRKINYIIFIFLFFILGVYVYLNFWKIEYVIEDYQLIVKGDSAIVIDLHNQSNNLLSTHKLIESDIFEPSGNKHISILTLEKDTFSQLKEAGGVYAKIDNITSALKLVTLANETFFISEFQNRTLFIAPNNSINSIAHIMWKHNKHQDIIKCSPKLCQNLKLIGAWGEVKGPFLETDIVIKRRALPRGRWAFAPATPIRIQSKIKADVLLTLNMLTFIPDLKFKYSGNRNINPVKSKHGSVKQIGTYKMYPRTEVVQISLQPGNNDIKIAYSQWEKTDGSRPGRTVYFTSLSLNEAE